MGASIGDLSWADVPESPVPWVVATRLRMDSPVRTASSARAICSGVSRSTRIPGSSTGTSRIPSRWRPNRARHPWSPSISWTSSDMERSRRTGFPRCPRYVGITIFASDPFRRVISSSTVFDETKGWSPRTIRSPSDRGLAARTPAWIEVLMPASYASLMITRAPSREIALRTRSASWPKTTTTSSTAERWTVRRTWSKRGPPPTGTRDFAVPTREERPAASTIAEIMDGPRPSIAKVPSTATPFRLPGTMTRVRWQIALRKSVGRSFLLETPPHLLRRDRHIDMVHSERVAHGVHIRLGGGNCPRLSDPLHAERVVRGGGDRGIRLDPRRLEGRGDQVFHQAVRQEVAALVVDGLFEHGLGEALEHASVDLSLHDHRIDLVPAVIDCDIAADRYLAGLLVDIDHADMGPEREDEVRRIVKGRRVEHRLDVLRHVPRHVGGPSDFLNRLCRLRRTLHDELAVREFQVVLPSLEQVGGDLASLVPHLARGEGNRSSLDGRGPAAIRPLAVRRHLRVPVEDLDIGDRDAELPCDDLGERRLFSLPVRMPARIGGRLARRMEPHGRGSPESASESRRRHDGGRPEAANLHVRGEADPHEPTLLPGLGLFLPELVVSDLLQGLLQRPFVVPAVVREAHRRGEGELVRWDEVLPAEVGRVFLELPREDVHHPLYEEEGLGAAGAAIRVDGGRVREGPRHLDPARLDPVAAADHEPEQDRRHARGRGRQVGAEVRDDPGADPEDRPVLLRREFHVLDMVPPMDRRDEVLRPIFDPLDRTSEAHREMADVRLPGIDWDLAAEPAADVRGDHVDQMLRMLQDDRQHEAMDEGVLGGDVEGEFPRRRLVARDRGPGLDRGGLDPL